MVLGGSVGAAKKPRIYVDLTGSSDRVMHAARLYHAGKPPLFSLWAAQANGGVQKFLKPLPFPNFFQNGEFQVQLLSYTSKFYTHQNALNTKRLLEQRKIKQILLVTSAIHMPRALATFRTMGINAIPSPTDYRVVEREKFTIFDLLPDAEALTGTTQAIKEYFGLIVYRWRGWIK